jgi:hypothetical protein
MSLSDELDHFTSGEPPDYDIAISVSSDDYIVMCSGIKLHRCDTSSMANKGRLQRALSSEIPNSSSVVGRNRYQAIALETDSKNYIGVAVILVVRMR